MNRYSGSLGIGTLRGRDKAIGPGEIFAAKLAAVIPHILFISSSRSVISLKYYFLRVYVEFIEIKVDLLVSFPNFSFLLIVSNILFINWINLFLLFHFYFIFSSVFIYSNLPDFYLKIVQNVKRHEYSFNNNHLTHAGAIKFLELGDCKISLPSGRESSEDIRKLKLGQVKLRVGFQLAR